MMVMIQQQEEQEKMKMMKQTWRMLMDCLFVAEAPFWGKIVNVNLEKWSGSR
jgi:hypothetical protein